MSTAIKTDPLSANPILNALTELALDLRWSWNHAADEIWDRLDPELWELTQSPWVVLQTISRQKLQNMSSDPDFRLKVKKILDQKHEAERTPGWFQKAHANSELTAVAYFSMEFMLSEALPIYSGGLGNVAGDQLKSASDLGVPLVGIGLLYQQGYFRQEIDSSGAQQALFPFNDPGQLPIQPLREANGEWLRIPVYLPGFRVWIRAWQVKVGRTMLYLLDTNDPANPPAMRTITSELYGGGAELRLRQELVLGIGGTRLLRAIGIRPEVCHLNEGHAAFAVLERARAFMEDQHLAFHAALAITRAGNLFTTHTPVEAGFDRFDPKLMEQYLKRYAEEKLGISFDELMALGRRDPDNRAESFNMAFLAVRGSGAANGVSRLHGKVSRRIFAVLFKRWPESEVPVGHITNGIHVPTWDSAEADAFWTSSCGKERWLGKMESMEQDIRCLTDSQLWQLRADGRRSLVEYTRKRLVQQLAGRGASKEELDAASHVFDADRLTLGFARRFATYKRPNLLLLDAARLVRILTNPKFPVQLILAGKAHPEDSGGQAMIKEWNTFLRRPEVQSHVVFLADYDMFLTQNLVQGVDLWINTPRRPWEASGTSGMKVLVNGGLNLSELDGWWAEAYSPEVGWAIGDGKEHGEDPAWDRAEADALYSILEREVIPQFYARDEKNLPAAWIARMRESMARLTPRFSANRAVREYTVDYYLPAATAYLERAMSGGKHGTDLLEWERDLARCWPEVRFGELKVTTDGGRHLFEIPVYLSRLHPNDVRVQLYAEGRDGENPATQDMERGQQLGKSGNGFVYSARVPASRPVEHFTPRVIPYRPGVGVPLETSHILWQR